MATETDSHRPKVSVARFLALVMACWLATGVTAGPVLADGQVGEPAPDFTLTNSRAELVEISFGQGEVFLLNFIGYS